MIIDEISRYNPSAGFPNPKRANLKTQAKILMIITFLIPYLFRKKGIVRMNKVSEICATEDRRFGCFTAKLSGYNASKSFKNGTPNVFVI